MTQKSLLHAVAAQIANGYETAEVPMYSEQLRMPDRKVIINERSGKAGIPRL